MPAAAKIWTIKDVLKWSERFLGEKGLVNPKSDAELLLMAVLNCQRVDLYLNFSRPLEIYERQKYKEFILRRAKNEPVQYITAEAFFMGMRFMVNQHVLIPRPDTEVLIDAVITAVKDKNIEQEKLSIIDIGSGSGVIAISLAKYLGQAQIYALDFSQEALTIAQANAQSNQVEAKIKFLQSNLLTEVIHLSLSEKVIIVSNPPYIRPDEYQKLPAEIKNYEPKMALITPQDELSYYRQIINQTSFMGDKLAGVFFEVGYNQSGQVRDILKHKYHQQIFVKQDLGGIARVVYTLL